MKRTISASLVAVALATSVNAAELARQSAPLDAGPKLPRAQENAAAEVVTVYLEFMPGTKVAHSIEMPSLEQCREATQFSSPEGARCVVVRKPTQVE